MNDTGQTDALAAEYVLGTLDAGELAQAQALLAADEAFAAKVKRWEHRLGELHLMVEPLEPDPAIWERIKAKTPLVLQAPSAQGLEPPAEPAPTETAPVETPRPQVEPTPAVQVEPLPQEPAAASAEAAGPPPATEVDAIAAAPGISVPATGASAPAEAPAAGAQAPPTEGAAEGSASVVGAVAPTTPATAQGASAPAAAKPARRAEPAAPPDVFRLLRRRLRRWRLLALLLLLLLLAAGGVVAAWKLAPDQVPGPLQPVPLLQRLGIPLPAVAPPPRPPAPPESQFDE